MMSADDTNDVKLLKQSQDWLCLLLDAFLIIITIMNFFLFLSFIAFIQRPFLDDHLANVALVKCDSFHPLAIENLIVSVISLVIFSLLLLNILLFFFTFFLFSLLFGSFFLSHLGHVIERDHIFVGNEHVAREIQNLGEQLEVPRNSPVYCRVPIL